MRSHWRVGRAVLGKDAMARTSEEVSYDAVVVKEMVAAGTGARAFAVFGQLVSTGHSVAHAQVATVRALCESGLRHDARALLLGLWDLPDGDRLRQIGMAQVLHSNAEYDLAWAQFSGLDPALLAELVPLEAATAALAVRSPQSMEVATFIARAALVNPELDVHTLVELAGRLLVRGEQDLARQLVELAGARHTPETTQRDEHAVDNLRVWTHPSPVVEPPAGAVCVGVMDYYQPDLDRASRNVGDYVQTLAMLGNIARFRETRFSGADGLGELATELQGRVRSELELPGGAALVHLLPISRDYSVGDVVPPSTWTVAFGWHMHSTFRLGFGLPYHPHINPIFVSFHINRVAVLTPEAITYLRAHGPIGCRDWTTVDLLLSAGVDAFFTGCLTTTVDAVFPERGPADPEEPRVVGVVDVSDRVTRKIKQPTEVVSHGGVEFRKAALVEGIRAADALLERYRRRFKRVVTSRLHAYLPATSLGIPVTFRPDTLGDVRFDGLLHMAPGEPAFVAIRDGIRELLAETFDQILAGAEREQVYAHWRELTSSLVAEAKERAAKPSAVPDPDLDVDAAVREIRAGMRAYGPHDTVVEDLVTDVAMSLDQNFKARLPVTVESMLTNATGPVRLWITARGLDEDYRSWFSGAFPQLPVTFLGYDHVDYGEISRMFGHISVATMDRLLLPEALPHLARITYLDIDTVTEGSVCELAAVDLQDRPLAARPGTRSATQEFRVAGDSLAPEVASDLRRTMSARHAFDFRAANAGVMVMNLDRMRRDNFVREFLPMIGKYGFNDQDVINAYVGVDRVELSARWNAFPIQEGVGDPGVVHYVGSRKPWEPALVPYGDKWHAYATKLGDRVGEIPD